MLLIFQGRTSLACCCLVYKYDTYMFCIVQYVHIKKSTWSSLLLVDSLFVDELKVGAWAKGSGDLEHGVALNWV